MSERHNAQSTNVGASHEGRAKNVIDTAPRWTLIGDRGHPVALGADRGWFSVTGIDRHLVW